MWKVRARAGTMPGAGGGSEEGREAGRNQERAPVLSCPVLSRGWQPAAGQGCGTVTWRPSALFEEWEQEGRARAGSGALGVRAQGGVRRGNCPDALKSRLIGGTQSPLGRA